MQCIEGRLPQTQLVQGQLEQLHALVAAALKQRVAVSLRWPQNRWVLCSVPRFLAQNPADCSCFIDQCFRSQAARGISWREDGAICSSP